MSDLLFVEENEKLFDEISEREKSKWEEIGFVSSGREHWFDTFCTALENVGLSFTLKMEKRKTSVSKHENWLGNQGLKIRLNHLVLAIEKNECTFLYKM